jgi:hypothetical protein
VAPLPPQSTGPDAADPPCFLGSARIRMADKTWRRFRDLNQGDRVLSANGKTTEITRVICKTVTASAAVTPYVIPVGQWGAHRRLLISPAHRIAVPEQGLIEARDLGLEQESMEGEFDYYNVELANNDTMIVEGVEVESLAPVRRVVMTKEEFVALIKAKYGDRPLGEIQKHIRASCRMLADGRIEAPFVGKRI